MKVFTNAFPSACDRGYLIWLTASFFHILPIKKHL